jgi:dihydrofolate reductase
VTLRKSVFIAMSLDGLIARPDGDLSWLTQGNDPTSTEDYGFSDFYHSVDTIVLGRLTYQTALSFPEWPYSTKRVVVVSHTNPIIPPALTGNVEISSANPQTLIKTLEASGSRSIYIDGGQTIQGFLNAGLIDEMTITIIPILLGKGIPLFANLNREFRLVLEKSRSFANGFVQNRYRVVPD